LAGIGFGGLAARVGVRRSGEAAEVLFETELGILGETVRIRIQSLQEFLELSANLLVA
jgi:hypothetical protein